MDLPLNTAQRVYISDRCAMHCVGTNAPLGRAANFVTKDQVLQRVG